METWNSVRTVFREAYVLAREVWAPCRRLLLRHHDQRCRKMDLEIREKGCEKHQLPRRDKKMMLRALTHDVTVLAIGLSG